LAWREPNHPPGFIDGPGLTVDPSETQRLVNGLRVGDALLPGTLLVQTEPELGSGGVLLQP
ncbi:MAG TPA: hypothetical protein VF660_07970, partial [Actinomycetota bacterium]